MEPRLNVVVAELSAIF